MTSLPRTFGRYQIQERLAVGGMAELFKGRMVGAHGFQKPVVIKRILPHLAADPAFVSMFIDEANITARLDHPKIVQVFELGLMEDELFIAMEFVDGCDLLAVLARAGKARTRIPPFIAAHIAHELLDALDYAHALPDERGKPLGIIHRDISPSNVLLAWRGDVKLGDFGIARAMEQPRKTQAGVIKGKYSYLSPEQVAGVPDLDGRSDLFAVGIVLSEMLTGRRLFKADNDLDLLVMVRDAKLDRLDEYGKHIDPGLRQILDHALKREREDRFQAAAEFRDALADWLFANRVRVTTSDVSAYMHDLFGTGGQGEGPSARRAKQSARSNGSGVAPSPEVPNAVATAQAPVGPVAPPAGPPRIVVVPPPPPAPPVAPEPPQPPIVASPPPPPAPSPPPPAAPSPPPVVTTDTVADARAMPAGGEAPEPAPMIASSDIDPGVLAFLDSFQGEPIPEQEYTPTTPTPQPSAIDLDAPRVVAPVRPELPVVSARTALIPPAPQPARPRPAPAGPSDEEGDLATTSPAAVLYRLTVTEATAMVRFQQGAADRAVFVVDGWIDEVRSESARESFEAFLGDGDHVGDIERSFALAMAPKYGGSLPQALVKLGALDAARVSELLGAHARRLLLAILSVRAGRYRVDVGRRSPRPSFPFGLDTPELLGAAAVAADEPSLLAWSRPQLDRRPLAVPDSTRAARAFGFDGEASRLCERLDGRASLRDHLARCRTGAERLRLLSLLRLLLDTQLAILA